jgi:hypothetical protein
MSPGRGRGFPAGRTAYRATGRYSPGVGLGVDWLNLWVVGLPFLTCACASGALAVLLYRTALASGLPHRRDTCARCVFESALRRTGTCAQACAVNAIPTLPLVLFSFTSTFALLFLFYPSLALEYVLPSVPAPSPLAQIVRDLLVATNVGASVVLAGYFVQDTARSRELFSRTAAAGALAGLVAGSTLPGAWGATAALLTPVALLVLLIALALEHRAVRGEPTLGLRAIGLATAPLFLIGIAALARIAQIVSEAGRGF